MPDVYFLRSLAAHLRLVLLSHKMPTSADRSLSAVFAQLLHMNCDADVKHRGQAGSLLGLHATCAVWEHGCSMWHVDAGTKKLFKMMLGTDSEFVNKFFQARKYWDINVGQWTAVGTLSTPLPHARVVFAENCSCILDCCVMQGDAV